MNTATVGLEDLVRGAIEEYREWIADNPGQDEEARYEARHEIAVGSVPTYTYDLLSFARHDLTLARTEPEYGPAGDGKATANNIIAAAIYERVLQALIQEAD